MSEDMPFILKSYEKQFIWPHKLDRAGSQRITKLMEAHILCLPAGAVREGSEKEQWPLAALL